LTGPDTVDMPRGASPRILSTDDHERLKATRDGAGVEFREFVDQRSPTDPLGSIAWLVGAIGHAPTDPWTAELVARIAHARSERFSWRQISGAMGEGDSGDDARRVRDRFTMWSRSIEVR
jgi:hypothetical protein